MKYIYLLTALLCINFQLFSQEVDDKIEAVLNDPSGNIRGKISETESGYALYYFDVYEKDPHVQYLQEKGFHGGGPSWLAMIYASFSAFEPNIIDLMDFEVQASGVTFTAKNKDDLKMVGKVISLIKSDEAIMTEMITRAQQLDIMK